MAGTNPNSETSARRGQQYNISGTLLARVGAGPFTSLRPCAVSLNPTIAFYPLRSGPFDQSIHTQIPCHCCLNNCSCMVLTPECAPGCKMPKQHPYGTIHLPSISKLVPQGRSITAGIYYLFVAISARARAMSADAIMDSSTSSRSIC
jgi:hypothetical protein